MPESIVPQAREIRAVATALLLQPQPHRQFVYRLPKHFPSAQIEALLFAVLDFTSVAEAQARELVALRDREAAQDAAFLSGLEAWEAEEDGRQFMETCALEHSFRDILR